MKKNLYKKHYILSYLLCIYNKNFKTNTEESSSTLQNISKNLKIKEHKIKIHLSVLKEDKCVAFNKSSNKYTILGEGISKRDTNYYRYQQRDLFIKNVKDFFTVILSLIAIATFYFSMSNRNEAIQSLEVQQKELIELINKVKAMESGDQLKQKLYHTDSLKVQKSF